MLSALDLAQDNLDEARRLRAAGIAYRVIARRLRLSPSQTAHIKRNLKREKAARTRLRNARPDADDRGLPVSQAALPPELRQLLQKAGYVTLGDIAESLSDPDRPPLRTLLGIGPHRERRVQSLLDQLGMLPERPSDLRSQIEQLFPEFSDAHPAAPSRLAAASSSRPHSR